MKYRATDGNEEILFLADIFRPLFGRAVVNSISTLDVTERSPIPTSIVPTPPIIIVDPLPPIIVDPLPIAGGFGREQPPSRDD